MMVASQDSFELSCQKRHRSSSVNIRVGAVESILERWIGEHVEAGQPRDIEIIMKELNDKLHWKVTVPPVGVLMKTASLVERFAVHAPSLLIKPATVVAALLNCHKRDALAHCTAGKVLGVIEDHASLIRCTITRWRELKVYSKRLDSVLSTTY